MQPPDNDRGVHSAWPAIRTFSLRAIAATTDVPVVCTF
jgi:hypothetical protein